MHFYTEHGFALPEADLQPALRGMLEPKREFTEFNSVPNYTWQHGEPANWNFYVTGSGPDLRKRTGLSERMEGPNNHLKSHERHKLWDVRYVDYFKNLVNMEASDQFTLSMLFDNDLANAYFLGKEGPIHIHVLLCTVVELNRK